MRQAFERNAQRLDRVFNPQTVAVVGDKRQNGYMWLKSMSTFKGKLYSVQIDEREIPGIEALGVENYPSLLDVPEPIDYVVVAVPRAVAPRIVQDCIRKGVGGATLFTSGFAETNTEEGIRLQGIITDMAKKADFTLIGPNCMGIFNPKVGVRHNVEQYAGEGGPLGFISQSGTHASIVSLTAAVNGVNISKSVSYGNAVILDSTDYLEYLAEDEETKVIGMYIEGVKDGRRFFHCLKEVAPKKPVVIWKGGQTEAGARAAASHTASLAASTIIWDAMIKQCGAIRVDSVEEMVDTVKALLFAKSGFGNRVGLVAMTGGQSVVITDTFAKAGLEVPLLAEHSYQELASFFNIIGGSYRNPLDAGGTFTSVEPLAKMLDVLDEDENIDSVVFEFSIAFLSRRWRHHPEFYDSLIQALSDFKARSKKLFIVILNPMHLETVAMEARAKLIEKGLPSFASFDRGARALKRVVEYYRFHNSPELKKENTAKL